MDLVQDTHHGELIRIQQQEMQQEMQAIAEATGLGIFTFSNLCMTDAIELTCIFFYL